MSDYEAAVEIGLEIRDVATAIRGIGGTDVESLTDISRSRRARVRELIAKIKERPVTEPLDPVDQLQLKFQRYKHDADKSGTHMLALHTALWERVNALEAADQTHMGAMERIVEAMKEITRLATAQYERLAALEAKVNES